MFGWRVLWHSENDHHKCTTPFPSLSLTAKKRPHWPTWGGSFQPPLVLCFQGQLWSVSQEMWLQKSRCLSYKHRIQETPSDLKQIDEAVPRGSTSSHEPSPQATEPSVCSAKFRLTCSHTVLLYKRASFSIIAELVHFLWKWFYV